MKRSVAIFAVLLLTLLAFAGCSSSARSGEGYYRAPEDNIAYDGIDPAPADPAGKPVDTLDPLGDRKIIRNASLTVEALEFDAFLESVLKRVNELGGYVESNVVANHAPYSSRTVVRTAKMTLRIPAERLDEFLETVNGAGNVTNSSENVTDVTDSYVDTEAKLRSLRTEYDTLLALLEQAQNLDEIIMLQDRLSNVRYEIESYEARIRSYDSQIAFSKVTLDVTEVERETAVEEETFGHEVSRRFKESLQDVGEGFRDFAAWFLGNFPRILVFLFFFPGIPLAIVLIVIACVKKSKKKRKAKAAAEAEAKKE